MDQQEFWLQSAEWLEQLIWEETAEQLRLREVHLRAQFGGQGPLMKVLSEVSDEGLILAIQKDLLAKEAFEELLEKRYKKLLFRWCYHWSLKFQDAEDLIYTLFLKFWKTRFCSYEPQEEDSHSFRSWLWTTAYNRWVQGLRKKKPGFLKSYSEPSANGPSAEQLLEGKELAEQLEVALGQLRKVDQCIMRAALDERTRAEIAQELNLSYRGVAMRLFRARRHLEQAILLPPRSLSARRSS